MISVHLHESPCYNRAGEDLAMQLPLQQGSLQLKLAVKVVVFNESKDDHPLKILLTAEIAPLDRRALTKRAVNTTVSMPWH